MLCSAAIGLLWTPLQKAGIILEVVAKMCKNKNNKIEVEDIANLKDCHVKSYFRIEFGEIATYKRFRQLTENNGRVIRLRTYCQITFEND